jgi:hypothetical protein
MVIYFCHEELANVLETVRLLEKELNECLETQKQLLEFLRPDGFEPVFEDEPRDGRWKNSLYQEEGIFVKNYFTRIFDTQKRKREYYKNTRHLEDELDYHIYSLILSTTIEEKKI